MWRQTKILGDGRNIITENSIKECGGMHYVTSDIHNDSAKLKGLLEKLELQQEDKLYILGDLFDRSNFNPDPVGVYFTILGLGDKCQVIRGNHEQELAEYITAYFHTPERKRERLESYPYNTFELLKERLTPVDVQNMAKWILNLPLQIKIEVNDTKYLLAHAMTMKPSVVCADKAYLRGSDGFQNFLMNGVEGYISICGHSNPRGSDIWRNSKGNVIICDCGCGFRSGSLGCLCLETGEEFYV